MLKSIFSFKALAVFWTGLLVALGSGAVALQLTTPPPAPPPPPVTVAAASPVIEPVAPSPPVPAAAPALPFENRSLLAMLPPRPALRPPAPPLPLPPVPPPARHLARAEPHRPAMVYASEPSRAYDPVGWGGPVPYPAPYGHMQPYGFPGPQAYYGW